MFKGTVWFYNGFPAPIVGEIIGPFFLDGAVNGNRYARDVGVPVSIAGALRIYVEAGTNPEIQRLPIGAAIWVKPLQSITGQHIPCEFWTESPFSTETQTEGATVTSKVFDYVVIETKKVVVPSTAHEGAVNNASTVISYDEILDAGTVTAADDASARAQIGNQLGRANAINFADPLKHYEIKLRPWA